MTGQWSDLELARLASMDDKAAGQELMRRFRDPVRRTVRYLVGPSPDGDDLCQAVLIEVLLSIGSFRGLSSLERFVDRIAVRTVLRSVKKRRKLESVETPFEDELTGEHDMERSVDEARLRARLADHILKLSVKNRLVVVLHYVKGYAIAEIADITGLRINTIRGRLREGRIALRRSVASDPFLAEYTSEEVVAI